jgi:hypothetical protein
MLFNSSRKKKENKENIETPGKDGLTSLVSPLLKFNKLKRLFQCPTRP